MLTEVLQLSGRYVLYAVPQGAAFFMKETLTEEEITKIVKAIIYNALMNNYAIERVAFGYEKVGGKVPVDLYLKDLLITPKSKDERDDIVIGLYIDKEERISAEFDYAEYVSNLFVCQIERIFKEAPKDKDLAENGEEIPLMPRYRDYLFGLLPLFTEVLNTEVKYNAFDVIPTDKATRNVEYPMWNKFVTDILLKPIKRGRKINRYVKDFKNAPYYVNRIIEKKKRNFYLKPIDVNSYEYAFALFSLMKFMNEENGKLFELKMREWESRQKK